MIFQKVIFLLWMLSIPFSNLSWGRCEGLDQNEYALCRALEVAEWGGSCESLKTWEEQAMDSVSASENAFLTCQALSDLASGGNCLKLATADNYQAFDICSEIYRGLREDDCSDSPSLLDMIRKHWNKCRSIRKTSGESDQELDVAFSAKSKEAFCEFGKRVRTSYPVFMKERVKHLIQTLLEPDIENLMRGEPLDRRERVKNLANRLFFLEILSSDPGELPEESTRISSYQLVSYLKNLVNTLENNRSLLMHQSRSGLRYHKIGSWIETEKGLDQLPSSVYVTPENQIIVRLKTLLLEGEKRRVKKVGEGRYKTFTLSFEYDEASKAVAAQNWNNGMRVTGSIRNVKKSSMYTESEWEERLQEIAFRDIKIQNLLLGKTGINNSGSVMEYPSKSHPLGKRVIMTQKYYSEDLFSYIFRFAKMDRLEGISKEKVQIQFAINLLRGLSAIHNQGIVHRDIKPENILIDTDQNGLPVGLISDFDTAFRVHSETFQNLTGIAGTPSYFSPEYMRAFLGSKSPHSLKERMMLNQEFKIDVWALGLVLAQLESGTMYPQTDQLPSRIGKIRNYDDIFELFRIDFCLNRSPNILTNRNTYQDIIALMLSPELSKRPSAAEALELLEKVQEDVRELKRSEDFGFVAGPDLFKKSFRQEAANRSLRIRTLQDAFSDELLSYQALR